MTTIQRMRFAAIRVVTGLLLATAVVGAWATTSSPFQPPEPKWGRYMINEGPGLDTGCTFRSGGPLIIQFRVFATMNPDELNGDGTLRNPEKLIENKVVGRYVNFSMPVFDIDSAQGEVDYVSLNGTRILTLTGQNNTWTDAWGANAGVQIQISQLRFSTSLTSGPTNVIRIDIDQASPPGEDNWCMAVDWVAVEFKAAFPVVLAHGIAANASTWDEDDAPGVLDELTTTGVRFTRFSTSNSSGRVADNARELRTAIGGYLAPMLADKVHIIAHSKGGLDSQYLSYLNPSNFEVLSLGTLSTPHRGSSVADVQVIQLVQANTYIQTGRDPGGYAAEFVNRSLAAFTTNAGAGPQPPGLYDLTTQSAEAALQLGQRGNVPNTFTVAADAGPNCTREPTRAELDEMVPGFINALVFGYVTSSLQNAYMIICNVTSAVEVARTTRTTTVCTRSGCFPVNLVTLTYNVVASPSLNPNDAVVAVRSAHPGYGTPVATNVSTNHSEVKRRTNVRELIKRMLPLE